MNQITPCAHLDETQGEACRIGRRLPQDCGTGCPAYLDGINQSERTRCEIWSRVMGYHRPVSAYNAGKQQEHLDRKFFTEKQGELTPSAI